MFDEKFFVDKWPSNRLEQPAIYLFSRPFDLKLVKPRDARKIYTTALLKASMLCSDAIRESIEVIDDDGSTHDIELSNGETVCVRAFPWGSKTLSVVFLFEHKEKYTLYTGWLTSDGTILDNKLLTTLMQQRRIDELYIDTTAYNINEFNLKRTAIGKITEILSERYHKKIHMVIDSFGYEDLIFELAENSIEIFLDPQSAEIFKLQPYSDYFCNDENEADIVLVNELAKDTEKQYHEDNIISIMLTTNSDAKDTKHLRFVNYTPYPTQADIFYIVSLAAPLNIIAINDVDTIPLELCELRRNKSIVE